MCSYCNSTFRLILRYECIYLLRIACSAPFVRWDKQYIPFDIFFLAEMPQKTAMGAAFHSGLLHILI